MRGSWVEPDVRDLVVETMLEYQGRTDLALRKLLSFAGISSSTYYEWQRRYVLPNLHNGKVPKFHWLLEEEKEAIVQYARENREEGYKRLTYRMIDEDVVYASPSSVYRVLKEHGLLGRFVLVKRGVKGKGYLQPDGPHREWHVDISYVNILGTFLFLMAVLDGYSRFVVHHELRASMEEKDVELVVQRALEMFPGQRPRIISDHGGQFISKEFMRFIRYVGLVHTLTSVGYPQSNGKIERFIRTAKSECIRKRSFLSIEDARRQIQEFIFYYNHKRLHSAIGFITPYDMLMGRKEEITRTREEKLQGARKKRIETFNNFSTLTQEAVLSNSR
ncbi:MAG: IS3 family transposase [Thermoplasmata archaeon]